MHKQLTVHASKVHAPCVHP